jgi:hypothetical protein
VIGRLLSGVNELTDAPDVNLFFAFARLGDVIRGLHTHERIHPHTKGFLDAERQISRKSSFTVKQAGQSRARHLKCGHGGRHREASSLDDFCAMKSPG